MKRSGQNFNEQAHSSVCPFVHTGSKYTVKIWSKQKLLRCLFSLLILLDLICLSFTLNGSAFVALSPSLSVGSFPFSAFLSSLQRRVPCTNQMTGQPWSTLSLLEPDRLNVDLHTSLSYKTALKIKLAISSGRPGQIMYYCKHGEPKHLTF